VKNRLRQRYAAGLRHGIGEQPLGFIRSFVRRQIVAGLEIDRVDFLYRDEFLHVDAAVRLGFQRFQLSVFDPYVLTLSDLVAAHRLVALDHDLTNWANN
jgi:hypothetical protein